MTWLCLLGGIFSLRYVIHPTWYDPLFGDKYRRMLAVVLLHGISSSLVLCIGPLQFIPSIRSSLPLAHRVIGRLYVAGVLLGSLSGFYMALQAYGGPLAQAGLCTLAILWLTTACVAFLHLYRRDVKAHRRWMIRNFSLTFAAVVVRIHLNTLQRMGWTLQAIYPYATWLSWIPCLIAAEIIIGLQVIRPATRVWAASSSPRGIPSRSDANLA